MEACCHFIALFGQICPSRRRYNVVLGRGDYPKWIVVRGFSPNCERERESKAQAAAHSFGPGPWHRADRGGGLLTASPLYHPQGLHIFLRPLAPFPRACVVTVSLSHYLGPTEEGCPPQPPTPAHTHIHPAWGPQQALGHSILGQGEGIGRVGDKGLLFPVIPFLSSVIHSPSSLVGPVKWVPSEASLYAGRGGK